ncbi:glycosyltransferase family A protein [Vibrio sp. 1567]|uniref:glycosyltransferase family 2 protein n=1 Tax=Vibrio sp. 1567 TaxID=3074564 RepID=UPI0029650468|nr:glycosyltransferase family A protein [Vibrio sp. 1567]MDW2169813.1 glycosyltransferase family A protein [Vibrio sp. 1567]
MKDKDFMIERPKVSIVCAWYNRSKYIKDTVDSLLKQEFDSFEVIIVNDGSTDPNVKQVLDSYEDDRLTIIHQENSGFVSSISRAISIAKGQFIAVQGSGDISLPNRIRDQYELIAFDDNVVAVSCWVETRSLDTNDNEAITGYHKIEHDLVKNKDFMKSENPFTHGEVMFRKHTYDMVNGYRSAFKYGQDRDLWLRMTTYGYGRVLKKVSYVRREFALDGVSTNIGKQLLQAKLTVLARQCNEERLQTGFDCIEKHGVYGCFYLKKDVSFKRKVINIVYSNLKSGNIENAILAKNELKYNSWLSYFFCSLLINIYENKLTRPIISLLIKAKNMFNKLR